ncbi:MAG: phosphoserine aminotransferase, partial [Myxococcota bacterium]
MKPSRRPRRPEFSSGPCAKHPGWTPAVLEDALVGRSHRAPEAVARLAEVIDRSQELLGIPSDYRLGIVPGSDTGAFEMALWSLLASHGAEVLAWESFGEGWAADVTGQLQVENARVHRAAYGDLPDLDAVDFSHDVVFAWNGTTSGVCLPDGAWIPDDRSG